MVIGVREPSGTYVVDLLTGQGLLSGQLPSFYVVVVPSAVVAPRAAVGDGRRQHEDELDWDGDSEDEGDGSEIVPLVATTCLREVALLHSVHVPVVLFRGLGRPKDRDWIALHADGWAPRWTAVSACQRLLPADDQPADAAAGSPGAGPARYDWEDQSLQFLAFDLLHVSDQVPLRARLTLECLFATANDFSCNFDDWLTVKLPSAADLAGLRRAFRYRAAQPIRDWLSPTTQVASSVALSVYCRSLVPPPPAPSMEEAFHRIVEAVGGKDFRSHPPEFWKGLHREYLTAVEQQVVQPFLDAAAATSDLPLRMIYHHLVGATRRLHALEPYLLAGRVPDEIREDLGLGKHPIEECHETLRKMIVKDYLPLIIKLRPKTKYGNFR